MTARNVKLRYSPTDFRNNLVEVDGTDITAAVRSIRIDIETPGSLPDVEIDLNVIEVDTETGAKWMLTERTKDALEALGWTPPGGDS